ncbi:MAG: glycosyltransferase [Pseudomonas sp.]
MIGVLVPVHNEERRLADCLRSLQRAASDERLLGEEVCIAVVLDACSDSSAEIAFGFGVNLLETRKHNVGYARRTGANWLLARGARWLACTDADSLVPANWLSQQIGRGADAVCGTVSVSCWDEHPPGVRERYLKAYQQWEGHHHIHGANLGVCADAYRRAGGFAPVPLHEDVMLVRALQSIDAHIVWTAQNSVQTSARLHARAAKGFSDYLKSLAIAPLVVS